MLKPINHEKIERNLFLMIFYIAIAISFGGLVEILPLLYQKQTTQPAENLKPYPALALEGRDIYIREGCHVCHTQMIRALRAETLRYGAHSTASEHVYEHPFLWGSKRTGPDLARVGGRYSDEWHRVHLIDPRQVVPVSNMPAYARLADEFIESDLTSKKMQALKKVGVPYTEEDIQSAQSIVSGKTAMDALIAYIQLLGVRQK